MGRSSSNYRDGNLALWAVLLILSIVVHLLLSWQGIRGLQSPGTGLEPSQVDIDLSIPDRAEPPKEQLIFEQPLQLEPPAVLMANHTNVPSPPTVDLALKASAGGRAEAMLDVPVLDSAVLNQGQGTAGFGNGIGTGLNLSSNRFAAYVQGLRETGLDIVFLVDATGSMDWAIAEVRQRIGDIVDAVRSLVPLARFSVVAYRDHDDPEFVTSMQPLTFSLTKLGRFLDALEAKGGGSWQEAITEGMEVAMRGAGWRPGAKQVVVIIGDAPTHEHTVARMLQLAKGVAARGGQVSTLDVSHDSNPALIEASVGRPVNHALYRAKPMLQFQSIADAGGGLAATMDGDIVVARQLLTLIMGGQFSREMALLMEGL